MKVYHNSIDAPVKWKSSKSSVAKVNSKGKVTAVSAGTATITATIGGKVKRTCTVTVQKKTTVLNQLRSGDYSKFAGTYVATSFANQCYGGGKPLVNLVLKANGSVSGGRPYYSRSVLPTGRPTSVKKNLDGSYTCIVNSDFKYDIYPKGTIENNDYIKNNHSYLKDKVYINVFKFDGGVYAPTFYKK